MRGGEERVALWERVSEERGAVEEGRVRGRLGEMRRVGMVGRGVQEEEGLGRAQGETDNKGRGRGGGPWGAVKEEGPCEDKEKPMKVARGGGVVRVMGRETGTDTFWSPNPTPANPGRSQPKVSREKKYRMPS